VSIAGQANLTSNVIWGFANGIAIGNGSPNIKILNNTFIRDTALVGDATALTTSAPTVAATIANNFFSGYSTPFGANFTGKTPILESNAYSTANVEMRGLSELGGGLEVALALPTLNLTGTDYKKILSIDLWPPSGCTILAACSPLLAGGAITGSGSPKYYSGKIVDVWGNTRSNRPEVGALELFNNSSVPARFRIFADAQGPTTARYSVTGLNFDTAQGDTVVVFWAKSQTGNPSSASNAGKKSFPMANLLSGDLQGSLENLEPETNYWFQVQATSSEGTGYVHFTPFKTTVLVVDSGTCDFAARVLCPETGSFGDVTRRFISQIQLSEGVTGGTTDAPQYLPVDTARTGSIRPYGDIPMVRLNTTQSALGVKGSNAYYTYQMEMPLNAGVENQQLFLLPSDEGGLPKYWPHWKVTTDNVSGTTKISVKINVPGTVLLIVDNFTPK
jgi:hypothetical protein